MSGTCLEVFHEHGDDDVDEHELRHEDEDDEEDGRDDGRHAAVTLTVVRLVAVFPQRVLESKWKMCKHNLSLVRKAKAEAKRHNCLCPIDKEGNRNIYWLFASDTNPCRPFSLMYSDWLTHKRALSPTIHTSQWVNKNAKRRHCLCPPHLGLRTPMVILQILVDAANVFQPKVEELGQRLRSKKCLTFPFGLKTSWSPERPVPAGPSSVRHSHVTRVRTRTFMMPFQLSPVATRKSVRKAMPKFWKCACLLRPSHGWSSEHSARHKTRINVQYTKFFVLKTLLGNFTETLARVASARELCKT